jgi:hypothetical protein
MRSFHDHCTEGGMNRNVGKSQSLLGCFWHADWLISGRLVALMVRRARHLLGTAPQ